MSRSERHELIKIRAHFAQLDGILDIPEKAKGIVLFVHGSGSGRFSPRNQYVAKVLLSSEIGTLLLDLLTSEEADDRKKVFDVDLLCQRLLYATEWTRKHVKNLKIGYFGASTGAAAALKASVDAALDISALVSRGGRPDLVVSILEKVKTPTLFIVGGNDLEVLRLNRLAYNLLQCEKELKIIPGATHLFEESRKLQEVAELATEWFLAHFK